MPIYFTVVFHRYIFSEGVDFFIQNVFLDLPEHRKQLGFGVTGQNVAQNEFGNTQFVPPKTLCWKYSSDAYICFFLRVPGAFVICKHIFSFQLEVFFQQVILFDNGARIRKFYGLTNMRS